MLTIFSYAYLPSVYFLSLVRCACSDLLPIFYLGFFFLFLRAFAYFRYMSFISYVFCKYFSQSGFVCLLTPLKVTFTEKTFSILRKSIKSNFHGLVEYLKTHHQTQIHLDFLCCFQSLVILHLRFKFIISFELIFVKRVKSMSWILLFVHINIQLF